jgi:hypothetical protein
MSLIPSATLRNLSTQGASGMKRQNNAVFWDVTPVALVRTDVSEERIASIIRMTRIGELRTTLAVTSNRSTLQRKRKKENLKSYMARQD